MSVLDLQTGIHFFGKVYIIALENIGKVYILQAINIRKVYFYYVFILE